MRRTKYVVAGLIVLSSVMLMVTGTAARDQRKIAMLDDCDPNDPTWEDVGGCFTDGDVTRSEFAALVTSPFSLSTIGHPSWRNEPSYLTIRPGRGVRVTNEGGRGHTFTKVAQFGGGRVPPLSVGLTPVQECILQPGEVDPTEVAAGGRLEVTGLAPGLHRFMCCFHPWMRAAIRVEPDDDDEKD